MVYAPGGYNFMDYIKFGVPLQLVCYIFTVAIVFSLEQWWAYALVLSILSPAIVGFYFFFGGAKVAPEAPSDDAKATNPPVAGGGSPEGELEAGRLGYRDQPAASQQLHAVAPPTLPQS
jgi:hypothetical protein